MATVERPVLFVIFGKTGADAEPIKTELERISDKLNLKIVWPATEEKLGADLYAYMQYATHKNPDVSFLCGSTTKDMYEQVFKAELLMNKYGWSERLRAVTPDSIKDRVELIALWAGEKPLL